MRPINMAMLSQEVNALGTVLEIDQEPLMRRRVAHDAIPPAMNRGKGRGRYLPRRGAFSLIELLIAVALVVIMYVLYLSAGSQSFQAKQKQACQKNLQNAYVALKTYSIESDQRFPTLGQAETSEEPLGLLVPRYTTATEFFVCPGTKDEPPPPAKPFGKSRISYAFYMGRRADQGPQVPLMSDEQVNTDGKHVGQLLFSADGEGPGNNHHKFGGVVLFCDGSAQLSGTNASVPLPVGPGVTLLNPKH